MTYDIISRRMFGRKDDYIVLERNIKTLKEASEKRQVTGDIVVYTGTNRIVQNKEWLWSFELNGQHTYALNEIKKG